VVVEEYFVPALNLFCVDYNIPDDVAGATFMVTFEHFASPDTQCASFFDIAFSFIERASHCKPPTSIV
jgi:hypothetical protein